MPATLATFANVDDFAQKALTEIFQAYYVLDPIQVDDRSLQLNLRC